MEKVVLIVPPSIDFDKFKYPPENVRTIPKEDGLYGSILTDIPLGVLALSSYVKKYKDSIINLIDFNIVLNKLDTFNHDSFYDYFKNYLINFNSAHKVPEIIGISTLFTTSYKNMLDISECCREIFPKALVIGGGGVPTNMYRQILKNLLLV